MIGGIGRITDTTISIGTIADTATISIGRLKDTTPTGTIVRFTVTQTAMYRFWLGHLIEAGRLRFQLETDAGASEEQRSTKDMYVRSYVEIATGYPSHPVPEKKSVKNYIIYKTKIRCLPH